MSKLIEGYDNISHEAKCLGKYLSMTEIQCEQVADATRATLQENSNTPVSTNVVTRKCAVVKGPLGPPEYEAEQARREKALLETSQEEETLVDPQDNADCETQDQTSGEQSKEQDDHYDSDADTIDPRE